MVDIFHSTDLESQFLPQSPARQRSHNRRACKRLVLTTSSGFGPDDCQYLRGRREESSTFARTFEKGGRETGSAELSAGLPFGALVLAEPALLH